MSLIPLLTEVSLKSGCVDKAKCEAVLAEAGSRQLSLISSLLEAEIVNEHAFAQNLAESTGLNYQEDTELDLSLIHI